MSDFRDNVEKHEAVNVPEDPDAPPEEWAKQQVGLVDRCSRHAIAGTSCAYSTSQCRCGWACISRYRSPADAARFAAA
jgi:hypothetical protein